MLYQLSYISFRYTFERLERETGIEPATNSLEGCDSTTELLPPVCAVPTGLNSVFRSYPALMHWANFSFALRAPAFTETSTACLTPTADSNLALRAPAFTERA